MENYPQNNLPLRTHECVPEGPWAICTLRPTASLPFHLQWSGVQKEGVKLGLNPVFSSSRVQFSDFKNVYI